MFYLKSRKRRIRKTDIEKIRFYGKAKQEVTELLSNYKYEYKNKLHCFILSETWYGKRRMICLTFENNVVEEKYIRTEYEKLSITKLYKNLS